MLFTIQTNNVCSQTGNIGKNSLKQVWVTSLRFLEM